MILSTHLNFPGNCAEAFRFYEQHLGARLLTLMKQSQIPGSPGTPSERDPVLHARLELGGSILIGNDVPPEHLQPMRSAYLFLSVDSDEEADRIYALLGAGGAIYMPLQETFFASRFSQLRDQFGVLWTLIHERPSARRSSAHAGQAVSA